MLSKMREHAQSWIAHVVVGFIALTFVIWGIGNYLVGGAEEPWKAKVNGKEITVREFRTAYDSALQQVEQQTSKQAAISPKLADELKQHTLDELIREKAIVQALMKSGYRISPGNLQNFIQTYPAFQEDGRFSLTRYRAILNGMYYTEDKFLRYLQNTLVMNQLRVGVEYSAFVLPGEMTQVMDLINQTRSFSYMVIDPQAVQARVVVSPESMQQYYDQNKEKFKTAEQIKIDYLLLSLQDIRDKIAAQYQAGDKRLQQFYDENKTDFSTPAKWQLAHILIRLKPDADATAIAQAKAKVTQVEQALAKGADFTSVVNQYSDDVVSRKNGGVLPPLAYGQLSKEMAEAVKDLTQAGYIAKPFRGKYGFEIVKVVRYEPGHIKPFNEVQATLKHRLADQQAEQEYTVAKERLSDLTFANPSSLAVASKALQLPIQDSDYFTREGLPNGLLANHAVIEKAFSPDVLLDGNNSDVIMVDQNQVMVLRVAKHIPEKIPAFAEVANEIKQKLAEQQTQALLKSEVEKAIADLNNGAALASVAMRYHSQWRTFNNIKRTDFGKLDSEIIEKVFKLPAPEDNKPRYAGGQQKDGNGLVFMLNKVLTAAIDEDQKSRLDRMLKFQIQQGNGQMDYEAYVKNLLAKSKIEHNTTAEEEAVVE